MTGIILYGPFELAPYSKKYMRLLESAGEEYDLIGWRREETVQYDGDNVFIYGGKSGKRYSSLASKLAPALGYRKFVKNIIKKKEYDKLIVLTTQTAILLADVLLKFRGRYIFDYRDKSYEYIKPYAALVNMIIRNSAETVISSEWFAEVLTGKKEYVLDHNFGKDALERRKTKCIKKMHGEKIVVGYIGALRQFEYHKQLIDSFKNDERFEFHTYGCGDDASRLEEYSKEFDNIFVHGAYMECEKYGIIEQLDVMCYNYPYSFVNDGAVANKYYDSLIMKKPMFVNTRTILGRFIEKEGLGVGVSEDGRNTAEKIYSWYNAFDADAFAAKCDFCLDKYIAENENFYKRIENFIR